MRKYLALTIAIFLGNICLAQNIQEKKLSLPDGSKLTYQILNNRFNGLYSIDKDGVNLLRGNYVNEKRVGNWYFFNKDKSLYMRYNYDEKKLLFVDDKTLALANVSVNSGNEEINQKASLSLPIFSLEQYFLLASIAARDAILHEHRNTIDKESVYVTAHINADGIVEYTVDYVAKKKSYSIGFKISNDIFNIEWIPASYNGTNYPSEFKIKIKLPSQNEHGDHKRVDWL